MIAVGSGADPARARGPPRHDAAGRSADPPHPRDRPDHAWPTTWPSACCTRRTAITPRASRSARRAISSPRPRSARCSANCSASALRQAWLDQGAPAPLHAGRARPRPRHPDGRPAARHPRRARLPRRRPRHADRGIAPRCARCSAATLAAIRSPGPTRLDDLPEAPLFLVANEFFDALPIRQFHPPRARLAGTRRSACTTTVSPSA